MTSRELRAKHADPALDRIEADDAHALLNQLGDVSDADLFREAERLRIARHWLRKHWSDGWTAAGGPAGKPEADVVPALKLKSKKAGRG